MIRRTLLSLLALVALATPAAAQITIPYSFTFETTIDQDQVNSNFTTLGNAALNRTGGTVTGAVTSSGGSITGSWAGAPTFSGAVAFSGTPTFANAEAIKFTNTGLTVASTSAANALSIVPNEALTAGRTLNLVTGDATRTVTLSGNPTLNDWFNQSVKTTATPTFAGLTLAGNVTSDLLFTDATYDVGKQAATRPRDLGMSRNLFIGGIRTLGTTVPNATYMEAPSNSVANNGTLSLGTYLVEGALLVNEWQNGKVALVFLAGGAAPQIGVQMSGNEWTVTKDNAGTMNIYWLTDHYEIQNKLGSSVNLRVWAFGAGATGNP